MQKQARITSKGQITVPHEIRKFLGVKPGDHLIFETSGVRASVRPVRAKSPFASYRGVGNGLTSTGRKGIVRSLRDLRGQ